MPQGGDRLERVLDLIGRVYDAALDEKLWAALAPAFAQAFNSTSTAVQIRAPETNATQILVRSENIDDRMDRAYCEYYYKQDV